MKLGLRLAAALSISGALLLSTGCAQESAEKKPAAGPKKEEPKKAETEKKS